MPRFPIHTLTPGQVTAAPVMNETGLVFLPAGAELTAALILRLQAMGVTTVAVTGDALTPEERAHRLAAIDARFEGHHTNPWMMRLRAVIVRLQVGEETVQPHA